MDRRAHRKPLFWVGSSRKDLREFPEEVKDVMGHALDVAQLGGKHPNMRVGTNREAKRVRREDIPVERSSGNVFEDLSLPESAERLVKSEIAARISAIIERRHCTQVQAAKLLGVDQADVSDLVRGKLTGFSTDRLFRF